MQGYKAIIATTALYDVDEPSIEELEETFVKLIEEINKNGANQHLKNPFWKIIMRMGKKWNFVKKEEIEEVNLKAGNKTEPRKKLSKDN